MKIAIEQVNEAQEKSLWDFGNNILYELCYDYPYHRDSDKVIAKIWLIGRAYAAAIERRKTVSDTGDNFYTKTVAPQMLNSKIDIWIESLSNYRFPTDDNIDKILSVHKKTVDLFGKISNLNKRSLASKYLHFHNPKLFYLFDTRALNGIRTYTEPVRKLPFDTANVDSEYAKFCLRCISLRELIKEQHGVHLTTREIDNFLLNT